MPKDNTRDLKELIQNLNKAEKRNFNLFLKGRAGGKELHYGQLFEALNKPGKFNPDNFLKKHPHIKAEQLSNLKISLYDHLLESLRQQTVRKDVDLQIREKMDYASVLYNKGLLKQSRQMLQKVTRLAERYHLDELRFEVLYREKIIELHFSGNNSLDLATSLRMEAENSARQIERINAFAGFGLQMHAHFVEKGYLENEDDIAALKRFYEKSLPRFFSGDMSFNERFYYYRAQYWYYYVQQDFLKSYRYSRLAETLIRDQQLEHHRPVIYLKTLNQLLNSLFRMNEVRRFLDVLTQLEEFSLSLKRNPSDNESLLLFRILSHHRINAAFMTGDFERGVSLIEDIQQGVAFWGNRLESRNIITLNYKFACLYFGVGQYDRALYFLNQIIHQDDLTYRQDIHGYARILRLVTLYEQGEVDFLFSNIRATYQYFIRMRNLDPFHQEILSFLRRTTRYYPQMIHSEFDKLRQRMEQIAEDPLARKPFYYFDIISWLASQVKKVPVASVIRERGLGHQELF
ncbi:hypothetical protein KFE98_07600 [bacterium SCSIO 12741]|nr:hypothetical protein KFE98_07600 [bacterium SCSIO 12741]